MYMYVIGRIGLVAVNLLGRSVGDMCSGCVVCH